MPLNLKKINSSDNIGDLIDKLNYNFNLLDSLVSTRGEIGLQGIPGQPGLRGEKGEKGDAFYTGKNVVFVNHVPNWGISYGSNTILTSANNNADNAIADGFKPGDIFIDLQNNVFYDIIENSSNPGHYIFDIHSLNYSLLINNSNIFIQDTVYNKTHSTNEGARLSSQYATLSLTSFTNTSPPNDSATYNDLITSYGLKNNPIFGWQRYNFKLSLDNSKDPSIVRSSNTSPNKYLFNLNQSNTVPLQYFGLNNPSYAQTGNVGIFLDLMTSGSNSLYDIFSIVNSRPQDGSIFYFDFYKYLFKGNEKSFFIDLDGTNDFNVFKTGVLDLLNDYNESSKHNKLSVGFTKKPASGIITPTNDTNNIFGIDFNLLKTSSNKLSITEFYYFDGSNKKYSFSLNPDGGITVNDKKDIPAPGFTITTNVLNKIQANDGTAFLIKSLNSSSNNKILSLSDFQLNNTTKIREGNHLTFGIINNKGSIFSKTVDSNLNNLHNDIIIQPNTGTDYLNLTTDSDINTKAKVSIGENNPTNSRFTISGNTVIGSNTYTNSPIINNPYGLRVDNKISISGLQTSIINDTVDRFGIQKNSIKLYIGNNYSNSSKPWFNKNSFIVLENILNDVSNPPFSDLSNGIYFLTSYENLNLLFGVIDSLKKSYGIINKYIYSNDFSFLHFVIKDNTQEYPGFVLDHYNRISIGGDFNNVSGNEIYYLPKSDVIGKVNGSSINPNDAFSYGTMLQLKKTLVDNGNPVRPTLEMICDDTSFPLRRLPSGFTIYGNPNIESGNDYKFRHFEPEIVFKTKFYLHGYKSTKIKQGYINSDKTYFTPNVDGDGGFFMVFSHNKKNKMFHDDWESLMVYEPTNLSTAPYKTTSTVNKNDFTLKVLPENRNNTGDFVSPPSGVSLTKGVYINSGKFYYTYPSKILFKRINERFSIFKFRIGIQIYGSETPHPAYTVNSNKYSKTFQITISKSELYSVIQNISYMRLNYESNDPVNFNLESSYYIGDIRNNQDFEDGFWMNGSIYSNINQITGTSSYSLNQTNPSFIQPSPSPYKYANSNKNFPLIPGSYVCYNASTNNFVLTNNFTTQWTLTQDDNNIYITIVTPEIIPLFNVTGNSNFYPTGGEPFRTIYFSGESIVDVINLTTNIINP
jgi:hypothetical protein